MRKRILYLVTALLLLSLLSGCEKETQSLPELSGYHSETVFPVGDSSHATASSGNSEHTANNSGFVVRDKKYTYEGYDLVILNVENQTEQNYSITINGSYLDENGEVLQEESQTFEGFEAGWSNYFLFLPELTFDRFAYTLDVQEFDGECVASKMKIEWNPGEVIRMTKPFMTSPNDYADRQILFAHLYFTDTGTVPMDISFHVVILNSEGEIFRINEPRYTNGFTFRDPYRAVYPPQEKHSKEVWLTFGPPEEDLSLPEELQDGFSFLVAVTGAEWDSAWTNQTA